MVRRMEWIHEDAPEWDEDKDAIVGGAPDGVFRLENYRKGGVIPGEWWRVEDRGSVVGYGWMDATWGDAQILLAVAPKQQGRGVGEFILEHLELEAAGHGLNYLYNVVAPSHPERESVSNWLRSRGFEPAHDDESLRRRVRTG